MSVFQTNRKNYSLSRIVEQPSSELGDGEVLVNIDRFAFTANNITYAVLGEQIRYWEFFPPADQDLGEWGVIPVWGFADVIKSNSPELPVGERLFGYFPPAKSLVMTPSNLTPFGFFDATEHRATLPPGYNMYRRVLANPSYARDTDNEHMVFFPLFVTSFCLHDMLQRNDWFGAEQVVIVSASSKTSIGLAYALDVDERAPTTIGLTSQRNIGVVSELGIYDQTTSYDQIDKIDSSKATVIIDMSGNADVLKRLHTHLGDKMRFTSNVGITHWEELGDTSGINTERSKMFFAPGHIQMLIKELGPQQYERKTSAFILETAAKTRSWMTFRELDGLQGLSGVYNDVCNGKVDANIGLTVVM